MTAAEAESAETGAEPGDAGAAGVAADPPLLLRVTRGAPTGAELAALVTVVGARSGSAGAGPPTARSGWTDRARGLRGAWYAGPGRWRASAWPR